MENKRIIAKAKEAAICNKPKIDPEKLEAKAKEFATKLDDELGTSPYSSPSIIATLVEMAKWAIQQTNNESIYLKQKPKIMYQLSEQQEKQITIMANYLGLGSLMLRVQQHAALLCAAAVDYKRFGGNAEYRRIVEAMASTYLAIAHILRYKSFESIETEFQKKIEAQLNSEISVMRTALTKGMNIGDIIALINTTDGGNNN